MSTVSPADRLVTLPAGLPSLTLGFEAVAWATKFLRQPNGERAGQRFAFTDSQARFLLWWYALDDQGRWLFHHGVRRLAKGSGKSPFAAVLALIELCGPVRLRDFDSRRPGGCVGKPVAMPLVQIAATAESQTANTMRMVRAFAPKSSRVVAEHHLDPGKTHYYMVPEGTLEVITASSTAAEGAEPSFAVGDETEWWKPSNGGPDLMGTISDNLTKSGNRMIETANAWVPGIESVAEATFDAWVAQEEGRMREGTSRVLYDARIAPPDTNLEDRESLRRGLEFVYDDCWWAAAQIDGIIGKIFRLTTKQDESKRKYLNWPTVSAYAWSTPQEWAKLAKPERVVVDQEQVVLFFDGSKSRDATALIGCCVSDGHVFTVDVWEPDTTHDQESVVPVAEVDAAVARAFRTWEVLAFWGDVREWESFVKVTWPELYGKGLLLPAQTGRDPQQIAWDMRGHIRDFTLAAELAEAEIKEGAFTHDGDPRVSRHVANCHRDPNRYGMSVRKEAPDSPRKIDAAVCVIGARMVRRLLLASGKLKKSRKVYSFS